MNKRRATPVYNQALVSLTMASEVLDCGRNKIYSLHRAGKLDLVRLDGRTKVTAESLRKLIEELPAVARKT